jgi:hypothetical protein
MKGYTEIDGKIYISSSRAHEISGYSKDYIGQLCRGKKIEARMIGRSWYVNEESLLKHKKEAEEILQLRNKEYAAQSARARAALSLEAEPVATRRQEPVQIFDASQMAAASIVSAIPQGSAPAAAPVSFQASSAPAVISPLVSDVSYE